MSKTDAMTKNPNENVQIMSILDRLEQTKSILDQTAEIEETVNKLNNLEYFLRRFGTLKELTSHLLFIERKMYILKEYLSVNEAADYLGLSSSLVYIDSVPTSPGLYCSETIVV